MPHKKPQSGKAKKEYLKTRKEERKASGQGAGFSSVVCDWGSTAVLPEQPPAADRSKECGPTWSGGELLKHGAGAGARETGPAGGAGRRWGGVAAAGGGGRGKKRGGGAVTGDGPSLMVQAPRNKLSTFFQREDDAAVQQRKLDATRVLDRQAHTDGDICADLLPRPLPWPLPLVDGSFHPIIPIPKRPHWRRDMSPAELEQQEQDMFSQWTASILEKYPRGSLNHFEHNLEVWRQLWRAVERSDIAVFVLDARLPLFHFQEAMWHYVTQDMGRDAIIVINKADLVHPHVVHLWIEHFKKRLPGVPVVAFYVPRSTSGFVGQPCTRDLLQALASCHVTRKGVKRPAADFMRDLLAGSSEQQDGVLEEDFCAGLEVGNVGGAGAGTEASMPLDGNARRENTFITVCLVGDPNMGKSSLMNSVFGKKIVSSSSTPGHTKHIQTYFLSRQLCMCDAPGIVCPRLDIPRELQVIFGTFRIAQVREPYSIIRYAADRCWPPLDAVYALDRFRDEADEGEWSPWSLCAAFAIKKSFKSKGGKPETHRAALMMLKDMMLGQKVRDAKPFTHKTIWRT